MSSHATRLSPCLLRSISITSLGVIALSPTSQAARLPQDVFDNGRIVSGSISVPTGAAVLDTNADGRLDVAVSETGTGAVQVFLDTGGANFTGARPLFDVSDPIRGLTAGDLDSDGTDELVLVTASRVLQAWSSDGIGGYTLTSQSAAFGVDPGSVELVDVNGDGALDAVVQPFQFYNTGVQVALGTGTGAFAAPSDPTVDADRTIQVQFRDMDGDGDLDLLAAIRSSASSTVLGLIENTGSYPYQGQSSNLSTQSMLPSELGRFEAFDADGDGDVDVMLTAGIDRRLQCIKNLGSGNFTTASDVVALDAVTRMHTFDHNGDGRLDVAVHRDTATSGGEIYLVQSIASGLFTNLGVMGGPRQTVSAMTSATFDGASLPSLVTTSGTASAVASDPPRVDLMASSLLGLANQVTLNETIGLRTLVGFDIDQDGLQDVLGNDAGTGDLVIKRSRGDGTFDDAQVLAAATSPGEVHFPYAVADVDGDAVPDVVYVRQGSASERVLWRRGMAGGGLAVEAVLVAPSDTPFFVSAMSFDDFDADGLPDLFLLAEISLRAYVGTNLGGGAVSAPAPVSTTTLSLSAPYRAADMDGDGRNDLLVGVGTSIRWLRSLPSGGFASPQVLIQTGDPFLSTQVRDIDEDGNVDLVYTAPATGGDSAKRDLVWSRNLGGLQFGAPLVLLRDEVIPFPILFEDVDLDGEVDLFFSTAQSQPIGTQQRLALGVAPGVFDPATTVSVDDLSGGSFVNPALFDITGDGALDLVASASRVGLVDSPRIYFTVALNESLGQVGVPYCAPIVANSTGSTGAVDAFGSARVAVEQLTLQANNLPPAAPGIFLTSLNAGYVQSVPGSEGVLCVGGAIGRFVGPGQMGVADAAGSFELELDLNAFPSPALGLVRVVAGETWYFQAWHRDVSSTGQPTSNFTSGLRVTFE